MEEGIEGAREPSRGCGAGAPATAAHLPSRRHIPHAPCDGVGAPQRRWRGPKVQHATQHRAAVLKNGAALNLRAGPAAVHHVSNAIPAHVAQRGVLSGSGKKGVVHARVHVCLC